MNAVFSFAGLNLNTTVEEETARQMHVFLMIL